MYVFLDLIANNGELTGSVRRPGSCWNGYKIPQTRSSFLVLRLGRQAR
jgi:hypothetical protein